VNTTCPPGRIAPCRNDRR